MAKTLYSAQQRILLEMLLSLRESAGVTQRQLARAMGVDQTFVSKCELGVRRIDVIELRRWTTGLGVPFDVFAAAVEEALDSFEASLAVTRRNPVQGKARSVAAKSAKVGVSRRPTSKRP